jgi:hypothetical protein
MECYLVLWWISQGASGLTNLVVVQCNVTMKFGVSYQE